MSSKQSPRFSAEESAILFGTERPAPGRGPEQGGLLSAGPRVAHLDYARHGEGHLTRFVPVLVLLALMWVLEVVDAVVPLDRFSLESWNPLSLYGLITSPLLHAGFGHLIANSYPFLILGIIIALAGARRFWYVTAISALASGLGAWLTTLPGHHIIGASGIVFGYFGYLAVRTWFTENVLHKIIYFAIGLFVFVTYGASLVFGMLPQVNGISWQGHLFGFAGGILAAWLIHRRQLGTA